MKKGKRKTKLPDDFLKWLNSGPVVAIFDEGSNDEETVIKGKGFKVSYGFPGRKLVYLEFKNSQVRVETTRRKRGLDTRIQIAIPRRTAKKLLPYLPPPPGDAQKTPK